MTKLRHDDPPRARCTTRYLTGPSKFVSDGEKAQRRKQRSEEARQRGEAIRKAEHKALMDRYGIKPRNFTRL